VNQPYSEEHGSILGDLVNRASHDHGLFKADNAEVYFKLEEATRGTPYTDSIKPFSKSKNGRGAFCALKAQYAGKDKWEAEIKRATATIFTRKWKGSSSFPLEKFVALHRNAYVSLQACSEYVEFQLPNAHSRVGYVLDAIETDDAGLQAAMANVTDDTGPHGKRGDFEAAVAYLLPKDPVMKRKQQEGKRTAGEIADATAEVCDFGSKQSIGKTGVHLRYHDGKEYQKLTKEQKAELREWRVKSGGGKSGKSSLGVDPAKKKAKTDKKAMAAAIKKGVAKSLAATAKIAGEKEEEVALLQKMISEAVAGKATAGATTATTAGSTTAAAPSTKTILKSILKKAKVSSAAGAKREVICGAPKEAPKQE
jgi:hypothetical protein